MAGMMRNLVTRVTVSAIVGAAVAGGILWLSGDSVAKSVQSNLAAQNQAQATVIADLQTKLDTMAAASTDLQSKLDQLVTASTALQTQLETQGNLLSATIDTQNAAISSLSTSTTDIQASITDVKATIMETKSQIEALKTQMVDNATTVNAPNFDEILDQMIGAVKKLEDIANTTPATE